MFISTAFAQDAAAAAGSVGVAGLVTQFAPLVLIFVVFYFLLIRPQQKKMKAHRELLASVRRGDRVVTTGGILALVHKVEDDNQLVLEIAPNVHIKVLRQAISEVVSKGEPAKEKAEDKKDAAAK
jgi:preprotein translocase subunit YajC